MLCEEVVGVSVGYAAGADAVAWCDWDLEVCVCSDVLGKGGVLTVTSYLKHDIEQPAFFVGMSLPPL
jgi:probable phosphoglycerate mutase